MRTEGPAAHPLGHPGRAPGSRLRPKQTANRQQSRDGRPKVSWIRLSWSGPIGTCRPMCAEPVSVRSTLCVSPPPHRICRIAHLPIGPSTRGPWAGMLTRRQVASSQLMFHCKPGRRRPRVNIELVVDRTHKRLGVRPPSRVPKSIDFTGFSGSEIGSDLLGIQVRCTSVAPSQHCVCWALLDRNPGAAWSVSHFPVGNGQCSEPVENYGPGFRVKSSMPDLVYLVSRA